MYLELTSLPLSISSFAIRAMKTNLGTPTFPISATGFPDSLISCTKNKQNYHLSTSIFQRKTPIHTEV